MAKDDLNLRDAGQRIVRSGLDRDVPRMDERQLANREARRENRDNARQQDEPRQRAKPQRSREAEPQEFDDTTDQDADEFEDTEFEDGYDADEDAGSTSDLEESDDEGEQDDQQSEYDDDEEDSAEGESRAKSLETEYPVKINGKTTKLPLKEIIAGYQRGADYRQKTTALSEHRRSLEDGHTKVAGVYQRRLQITAGVVDTIKQMLIGDVNSVEMQSLRATDPAQWAVQRQVMNDRIQNVNNVLSQIQQEQERHLQDLDTTRTQQNAQAISHEEELLVNHIPDWRTKGKPRLAQYLVNSGFSAPEIQGVADHRMLVIAEKARRFDQLMAEQKAAERRRKQPGRPKPKSTPTRQTGLSRSGQGRQDKRERSAYNESRKQLKKTGNMRDAGRAIARSGLLD